MECEMSETTTLYEKSSSIITDEDKSTTLSEKSLPLAGMKRKLEEEEEESEIEGEEEDSESDSDSEDESEDEESEIDEDVQPEVADWYADEPVEEILIDGEHFTNERLLDLIMYKDGEYAYRRTTKFLNKIRRYLKSVYDSDGFDISEWPGNVSGITHLVPKDYIIKERLIYPECYKYIGCLADLAIEDYNNRHGTYYYLESIEKVNSKMVQGYTYYITFNAFDMNANVGNAKDERTFQAKVWDDITHREIHVCSCNLKPT